MTAASLAAPPQRVILGVDTVTHVGVALDDQGRKLGAREVPTTTAGYDQLPGWAQSLGPLGPVAVAGTGSYGAGMARHLRAHGVQVLEADRPTRQTRRAHGKSDPSTPRSPPGRCWPAPWGPSPRPPTGGWRACGYCASHALERSRHAPKPSTRSTDC